MNKIIPSIVLLSVMIIGFPSMISAQTKEVNKTSLGLNGSLYTGGDFYSFSPKLQISRNDYLSYSIGPLFKVDNNYRTTGLDFVTQMKIGDCNTIKPIMDLGLQYFNTKSASDSIKKNLYVTMALGCIFDYKIITMKMDIGVGTSAMTRKLDLWYMNITFGFPKLYSYKSLIKPIHKVKRHSKSED